MKRVPTSVLLYVVATSVLVVFIGVARLVSSDVCCTTAATRGSLHA